MVQDVTWIGCGSRLPSLQIWKNTWSVPRFVGSVRNICTKRDMPVFNQRRRYFRGCTRKNGWTTPLVRNLSQDSVQIHEVKGHGPLLVENPVGKQHRYVVLREAGKAESCVLISGVMIVEQEVEARQPFVHVLGCRADHMIVVPERAQGFIEVTALRNVIRQNTSVLIGIVLVIELAAVEEVAGVTITL